MTWLSKWGYLGLHESHLKMSKRLWTQGGPDAVEMNVFVVGSRSLSKAKAFCTANGLDEGCAVEGYDECIEKLASYGGHRLMYVPLPTTLHLQFVKKIASKGIHILLEKPCAVNVEELDEMIQACSDASVRLYDGTMFMHHPRLENIKQLLSSRSRPRYTKSEWSFKADETFMKSDIRIKATGDPLGCLGDLGWYNIRWNLFTANYSLPSKVEGRIIASSDEGVPTDFQAKMVWETQDLVAQFTCSFLRERLGSYFHIIADDYKVELGADFVVPTTPKESSFSLHESNNAEMRSINISDTQECRMFKTFGHEILSGTQKRDWVKIMRQTQIIVNALMTSAQKGELLLNYHQSRRGLYSTLMVLTDAPNHHL